MKRLILLMLASAGCFAASPCSLVLNHCLVNIPSSDYSTGQLQTAINDGIAWQGSTPAPYVIQITAGTTITGNFTLGAKTCAAVLEIRSSGVSQITGRVTPAQASLLATIQSPSGGAVLTTITGSGASCYALRGLKLTEVPLEPTYPFAMVSIGDLNSEVLVSQSPSNIEIDRCWITGVANEEGPDETLIIAGSNISVHDCWIENAGSTYFDAQGILIANSQNVSIVNNYVWGTAENIFIGDNQHNSNIDIHGNHSYKPPLLKWSNGTGAPSGACFNDATSGERYTQFASALPGAVNVTGVANNGSGLIRVTVPSHGFTTGNTIQIVNGLFGVSAGALGPWVITVIDANNFDLQGSTFVGSWNPGTGILQKVTQLWVCAAGSWTTTSSLFSSNWIIKNDWETKGGDNITTYGNVLENAWTAAQDVSAIINQVTGPHTVSNVSFYANRALNSTEGFVIGGFSLSAPFGPLNVNIHDNLWPTIGIFSSPTGGVENVFRSSTGVTGGFVTNVTYRHNTSLARVDNQRNATTFVDEINTPANLSGFNVYADNLVAHGYDGIATLNGVSLKPGWCSWAAANKDGYLFGHNVYSTVDQPGFVLSPFFFSIVFAAGIDCATNWSYTLSDTWLHTADYSTVFTTTAGALNTWDYKVLSSYAPAHNAATDGRDIGADIALVNAATASAVSGTVNPWFAMSVKPPATIGTTTATIQYVAPTTAACTLTVYSNETLATSAFSATDGGGNPARSASVTGLTSKKPYWPVLSCASGAYVQSTSAQVAPFVTQ